MKFLLKNTLTIVIVSFAMMMAGCEGEPGPVGPAGPDGANGANGANGENGANGRGFDDAISRGGITITYSGTMPVDSIPFEKTLQYPFSSSGDVDSFTETWENYRYFDATRWYGDPSYENPQDNGVLFSLTIDENAEPDTAAYFYFFASTTIIQNTKFFDLNTMYEMPVPSDGITEYFYDPQTGALSFHFEFVIPADANTSGFDVTVSGDADIIVYEELGSSD